MITKELGDGAVKPTIVHTGMGIGNQIGPYLLVERLGRGGQADVWSAWDTRLSRTVAIKLISMDNPDLPSLSRRKFEQEAQTVAQLEHPNIVPLYDFGETDRYRYLVMRYMAGGSLLARLQRAPLTIGQAMRIAFPLAEALDYVHGQGVVHRDLKSGNILLDLEGRPYLGDFGLARETKTQTLVLHSRTGTLPYMSPEQLNGQPLTYKSDLYSFGILLYEILCGHLPFDGSAALAVVQMQTGGALPDPAEFNEALPPVAAEVLRALTNIDIDKRPDNVTEAVNRLAEAVSVSAAHVAPWEAALDWHDTLLLDTAGSVDTARIQAREAQRLLQREIEHWRESDGMVRLSVTHFVLIDQFYAEADAYHLEITDEIARFMLRAALRHDYHVRHWWDAVPDPGDRLLACWDVLRQAEAETMPRLLERIVALGPGTIPTQPIADILDHVADVLDTDEGRAQALAFLEEVGGSPTIWEDVAFTERVDQALADLALSTAPDADAAAALVGKARSLAAVRALLDAFRAGHPRARHALANVRNAVDHLPRMAPLWPRAATLWTVLWWQISARWQRLILWLAASVIGCGVGLGIVHFALTPYRPLVPMFRITDSLSAGLILGLTVGMGVGLTQIIVKRWRALRPWLRLIVGSAPGFALAWFGFYQYTVLFQKYAPQGWAMPAGALILVLGFALGQAYARRAWLRALLGAGGVWLALWGMWQVYLATANDPTPVDPLIYLWYADPAASALVPLLGGAVAGVIVTAPGWAPRLRQPR
ncbi:MAG: hypothetical protein Kow00120_13600 [Anaerolineae bacterium]